MDATPEAPHHSHVIVRSRFLLLALALSSALASRTEGQTIGPDTVLVRSGDLHLTALLWRPEDRPPFPAVLFIHGSPRPADTEAGRLDRRNHERLAAALGPVFAGHGYVLLFLYSRGCRLSAHQGTCSGDLMSRAYASNGQEGRNHVQLELLEGVELEDVRAGLDYLRSHPEVDADRLAVAGHSFGGSLALLVAESDTMLRAVIDFAGAAGSWESSLPLQARLLAAVGRMRAPVFFIQAENDYSVMPAEALAAEMTRLGKPHRIEIYPAIGSGAEDGHAFVRLGIAVWESDVFAFLDERMQR